VIRRSQLAFIVTTHMPLPLLSHGRSARGSALLRALLDVPFQFLDPDGCETALHIEALSNDQDGRDAGEVAESDRRPGQQPRLHRSRDAQRRKGDRIQQAQATEVGKRQAAMDEGRASSRLNA
jgi:hypothetical protein